MCLVFKWNNSVGLDDVVLERERIIFSFTIHLLMSATFSFSFSFTFSLQYRNNFIYFSMYKIANS